MTRRDDRIRDETSASLLYLKRAANGQHSPVGLLSQFVNCREQSTVAMSNVLVQYMHTTVVKSAPAAAEDDEHSEQNESEERDEHERQRERFQVREEAGRRRGGCGCCGRRRGVGGNCGRRRVDEARCRWRRRRRRCSCCWSARRGGHCTQYEEKRMERERERQRDSEGGGGV